MKRHSGVLLVVVILAGCGTTLCHAQQGDTGKILNIQWQRLVNDDGQTCKRCGGTQEELGKAAQSLKASLAPLGIDVVLKEKALSPEECAKDISQSNRIWIADRPLADWLGGDVGKSACGSCCAELGETVECRTLSVDGKTYEVIPAQLIVKAGLLAAAQIVHPPSPGACCPASGESQPAEKPCCPKSSQPAEKPCCPKADGH